MASEIFFDRHLLCDWLTTIYF